MNAQEFTNRAIEMAKQDAYNKKYASPVPASGEKMEGRRYAVTLPEETWGIVLGILEKEEKWCKSIIKGTYDRPSDTISSDMTRDKFNRMISEIQDIKAAIIEEAN